MMDEPVKDGTPDPGIAVALGSAFLGMYAHSGFLCGLNDVGIFPGHVSGTSAGAIAGGFYAAGLRGVALKKAVLAGKFKRSFADAGILFRWIPMFFWGSLTGLLHGRRVVKYLRKTLPVAAIEDAPGVKLSLAVTDLRNSRGLFLRRGPLAESIMASCSVPLLFASQRIGETELHDGGILHELPLEPFLNDPSIHTIILHKLTYPECPPPKKLKIPAVFCNSHRLLNEALLAFRLQEAQRNGKKVIFVETDHSYPGFFQSKETKKEYFEDGYRAGMFLKHQISP
jgi:NTE family protein